LRFLEFDTFLLVLIFNTGHTIAGDRYLKPYVISDPEVTCIERNLDDECLILASDGLWDVMSSDCACEVARRVLTVKRKHNKRSFPHGKDQASSYTASFLAKMAHERGSKDNITVIVVDLKS
jgi:protein phosphatase 2C